MSENLNGVIVNVPLLDLRHMSCAEELSAITGMQNVGLVLVPEELMVAVNTIQMKNVGAIVPLAKGDPGQLKTHIGQMQVDCAALSNPDDIVALAGQIIVTTPVADVRCRLVAVGQILLPDAIKAQVAAALIQSAGQIGYYKGERAYVVLNEETFGKEFFEALPSPITLVNHGPINIESDVSPELFKSKVSDMVIHGPVTVPRSLKALVQAIAIDKQGPITVID